MKEYLNEHTIANAIRQARQVITSTFLIVEGDIDSRIYKRFIGENDCQTQVAYNKDYAIKALKMLQDDNIAGVLAIIDADFDKLENKDYKNTSLFLTDLHDIECVIISSSALEKILSEFGSEPKLKTIKKDVCEWLFELGSSIGYLRWISLAENLNLKFEELDFGKFIKKEDLTFDLDLLVTTVKNKSHRQDINSEKIVEKINKLISQNHDKRQICCGKDLIEILSIGLQKVLGTNNSNKVTSEILARDLRLAYEFEYFISTNLYQDVKKWESHNPPFKVFK